MITLRGISNFYRRSLHTRTTVSKNLDRSAKKMQEREQETQRPWLHPFSISVVSITQKNQRKIKQICWAYCFFLEDSGKI
jgi:hypothetical protein